MTRESRPAGEPFTVFLGGRDPEMAEVSRLLAGRPGAAACDRGLAWGARAAAYQPELRTAGRTCRATG